MKELSGVYLVLDPKMDWEVLIPKLKAALAGGIGVLQIWNHWQEGLDKKEKAAFIHTVKQMAHQHEVPVLMHDDWRLAMEADLDGVHFDVIPEPWEEAKKALQEKIIGVTVGNDLQKITWAHNQGLGYISFCAMFPSPSVGSCEIVSPDSVKKARSITQLPIFLSGGITPHNLSQLKQVDFQGVAIISGVMSAEDPKAAVSQYRKSIEKLLITSENE